MASLKKNCFLSILMCNFTNLYSFKEFHTCTLASNSCPSYIFSLSNNDIFTRSFFVVGNALCSIGCLAASLASTYYMPVTLTAPPASLLVVTIINVSNVSWGTKLPLAENHCTLYRDIKGVFRGEI